MEEFSRLEISTTDRMGMTMQILEKLYEEAINLHSIEVFPEKVYIKMHGISSAQVERLKQGLYEIEGVRAIRAIELLNYEKNERKLLAIIDSVDEGIIAINKEYEIEIFNNYCEGVFHYTKEEVLGNDIRGLIGEDLPIVTLVKNGQSYNNFEIQVKSERGNSHYITTGRPVKDDQGGILGAVASIKDIHKAMELVNVVSATAEGAFTEIIGNSLAMEKVKKISGTVAKSDSTILLRGESGTGKELFARAIHRLSPRKDKPFVTINCAALPDTLIESELFGYERGSFTGAINSGKDGLFKEADGGTLFLDEIGELSVPLQAKLLRVLQEGVIRKIGSTREEKVNVRIIAATNKNLEQMIKNATFREDLYYRLNVVPVFIPPLRERKEDIPVLAGYFLKRLGKKTNKVVQGADMEFINRLMEYEWPGNVRELQNVIERAMNLCEGNLLTLDTLIIDIGNNSPVSGKNISATLTPNMTLDEMVEACEKRAVIDALARSRSYREAAKILGVSHTTILNKVKKYKIDGNFYFHM